MSDAHSTGDGGDPEFEGYEAILETVDDAVFVVDEARDLAYANRRALENADSTLAELRGTPITTITREMVVEDASRFEQALAAVFEADGETTERLVLAVELPSGTECIEYKLSPIHREGAVRRVVVIARDVTERRRRKDRLRQLAEEYERIFDAADDAIFLIDVTTTESDVEFRVERFNQAYEAMTGLTTDEARGQTPRELLGEDVGSRVEATYRQCVERREPVTEDEELPMPDGQVTVQTKLEPVLVDGEVTQIVGISRDITEQVAEERELQKRERQLTQLHAATRDLLRADTPRQVAAVASEAADDILELELNGIHFYDEAADALIPVAVSEASRELLGEIPAIDDGIAWDVFQQGEPQLYDDIQEAGELYNPETPLRSEMFFPLADHGVFIISSRTPAAFTATDTEFARTLVANTEAALHRVTGEQRLRARQQELERQNERLEEFASIVSHDLRNPLNVAEGRLEMARADNDTADLAAVARAHDRIETLIEDLLTLAQAGDSVDDAEAVDLAALVQECWTTVQTGGATYTVDTDRTVWGDRSRLRQLLENLLRNAVDHGGPDVTVTVGDLADGFYVADDGPGIPAGQREQVFEEGHTTSADGTGFGLAIVDEIVQGHGWTLTLTESDDGGARFEITGVDDE